jgi:hypothetical protein
MCISSESIPFICMNFRISPWRPFLDCFAASAYIFFIDKVRILCSVKNLKWQPKFSENSIRKSISNRVQGYHCHVSDILLMGKRKTTLILIPLPNRKCNDCIIKITIGNLVFPCGEFLLPYNYLKYKNG